MLVGTVVFNRQITKSINHPLALRPQVFANHVGQPRGMQFHVFLGLSLDHDSGERLGAGVPHYDAAPPGQLLLA